MDSKNLTPSACIKVIGAGGAGGNAINTMIQAGLSGVEFIAANTDVQALQQNLAPIKIQIGQELTKGLGAGANPDVGRDAALESKVLLQEALAGSDMVFITAGMGGGTGTGAAPIIAQVAREMGALTVGVVTKPFTFEGKKRRLHCDQGIMNLRSAVDTLITIPNQRLLSIAPAGMPIKDAFKLADDVLLNAVRGISEIIGIHGDINVDFADVRTTMAEMGMALMGTGIATGPTRAQEAARAAINSPLLEDIDIEGATGLLVNIAGPSTMTMQEYSEAAQLIQEAAHEDANVILGMVIDDTLGESLRVTVIATGFDRASVAYPDSRMPQTHGGYPNQNPYGHGIPGHAMSNEPPMARSGQRSPFAPPLQHDTRATQAPAQQQRSPYGTARPAFENRPHAPENYGEQGRDLARRAAATAAPTQRQAEPARPPQAEAPRNPSEYEDLTQWTLDLATNTPAERPVTGATAREPDMALHAEHESENALNIARELAGVSIDDSYETPAYLRRRDEPGRNP